MSDYKITSAKVEEVPFQISNYQDGEFSGVVVLTNFSNIYMWSTRFNTWTKLAEFNIDEIEKGEG